jgi:hypothetical protein
MTGSSRFQDVIDRGLGIAARQLGSQYTAFRPKTGMAPLDVMNRFLNLPAWFNREVGQLRPLSGWADACWNGVFDRAYTLPGDYLHGPLGTFFVALQDVLLPALCVRTNRTVDVNRPTHVPHAGRNAYGGLVRASETPVLVGWPASLLLVRTSKTGAAGLASDSLAAQHNLLLPRLPDGVPVPRAGDLVCDDLGNSYVIDAAEQSELGWRLAVRAVSA